MAPAPAAVLAINGGSSSIKFAVYRAGTMPTLSLSGTLDRIGRSGPTLSWGGKQDPSFEGHTGGPDTLVFSAGIGERSASIRARICEGLGFLGIELHDGRNAATLR